MTRDVKKSVGRELVTGILIFLGAGMSAHATPMQAFFNFGSPLANNAGPAAIKAYMDPIIAAAFGGGIGHTVTVSAGAIAQNGATAYTGDGHVVGLGGSTTAYTLAVKDGGFLMNNGPGYNEFDLTFTDAIDSVSFDYQIFPDGSTSQPPDFIFKAGALNPVNFTVFGTVPTSPNNKSAAMPLGETNAQAIGTTGLLAVSIPGGTMMQWIDWPPEVGMSNFTINFKKPPSGVPEPASIFLFGSSLLGCLAVMRRKMQKV